MARYEQPSTGPGGGHRVVVTGMGVVSPVGTGVGPFWDALLQGRTAWSPGPEDPRVQVAGVPDDGAWDADIKGSTKRYADRAGRLAIAAARMAVRTSGWEFVPRPRRRTDVGPTDEQQAVQDRVGVVVGSSIGGVGSLWEEFSAAAVQGTEAMTPFILARALINMIPASIAIDLGVRGESLGVAGACAAGTMAIGEAYRRIRDGRLTAAVAGGADACLVPAVMAPFLSMGAMSPAGEQHGMRPFAADRNGFLMGEGAAMLVLETEDSARARGAEVLAEIVGYHSSTDAVSLFAPDPAGIRIAVEGVLEDAGVSPDDVVHISAHATGTKANDAAESVVYGGLFPHRPPVAGVKANTGHALGASGAFEAVAAVMALRTGLVPPVAGLRVEDLDPDVRVNPALGEPARLPRRGVGLSASYAFGGQNAILALV